MYLAVCFPTCLDVFAAPTYFRSLMVRLALTRSIKWTNFTVTSLDLPGHRVGASKDAIPSDSLTKPADIAWTALHRGLQPISDRVLSQFKVE
jgi:hypothetical protein